MGRDRPDRDATEAENENRKSYGQLWLAKQVLRYHLDNVAAIQSEIAESIAFQKANVGPDRLPRLIPVAGVPAAAERARRGRPIMGILEDATMRLLPHPGAVLGGPAGRDREGAAAAARHRCPSRAGPGDGPRPVHLDEPAVARVDPAPPRRSGGRADGRRRAVVHADDARRASRCQAASAASGPPWRPLASTWPTT